MQEAQMMLTNQRDAYNSIC